MNEKQWLTCTNPSQMLEWLDSRAGERKSRLFACACCRRIWPLLSHETLRQAVETSERFADGLAGGQELEQALAGAQSRVAAADREMAAVLAARKEAEAARLRTWEGAWIGDPPPPAALVRAAAEAQAARAAHEEARAGRTAARAAEQAAQGRLLPLEVARETAEAQEAARSGLSMRVQAVRWTHRAEAEAERPVPRARAALRASRAAGWVERAEEAAQDRLWRTEGRIQQAERKAQGDLVREIFGNPFRTVAVDPAWLRWNEGTVTKIAQTIYEDNRFGDLPVLGDALEEAGCRHADILGHCRSPGKHARGCWVVDAVLGKGESEP